MADTALPHRAALRRALASQPTRGIDGVSAFISEFDLRTRAARRCADNRHQGHHRYRRIMRPRPRAARSRTSPPPAAHAEVVQRLARYAGWRINGKSQHARTRVRHDGHQRVHRHAAKIRKTWRAHPGRIVERFGVRRRPRSRRRRARDRHGRLRARPGRLLRRGRFQADVRARVAPWRHPEGDDPRSASDRSRARCAC